MASRPLAADSARALKHFESLLEFETDCWDVHHAIVNNCKDFVLLDVRGEDLYQKGHIEGAISLPHARINEDSLKAYPPDTLFVVYCAGPHCNATEKAAIRLAKLGRTVKKMIGGVTGWLEEELESLGHSVERVYLASKKVNGCISCYKCKDNPGEPGCVQKDDGPFIINQMVASDIVIYASPLYYWGFSAQMKAMIDRCFCLYRGECGSPEHTSFVEGQRQALIVTAADPFEENADQILTAFQRMLVYNKTFSAGELFICNSTTPDELGEEIEEQAKKFAQQLFGAAQAPYALLIPGGALNKVPKID